MTDISRIYYLLSASISRIVEGFNTYNTGISYNLPQTTSTNQSNEGVRLQEDPSNHLYTEDELRSARAKVDGYLEEDHWSTDSETGEQDKA